MEGCHEPSATVFGLDAETEFLVCGHRDTIAADHPDTPWVAYAIETSALRDLTRKSIVLIVAGFIVRMGSSDRGQ